MNLPRYRHQALGDLMHVVLDPLMRDRVGQAHVRNDNHPEGDEQTVAGACWNIERGRWQRLRQDENTSMTRRGIVGLLAGAVMLLLGACGVVRQFPTYRYRLTVEVNTPEGLKAGSNVIEVRTGAVHLGGIGGGASAEVSGEAVTVDLGARGLLFALLRSEGNGSWAGGIVPTFAARPEVDANHSDDDTMAIMFQNMLANKGLIVLPRYYPANARVSGPRRSAEPQSDYPMLVRFGDVNDPKTVAKVDPDDLAGSFGPGFALRRITVQLTDDPVTSGIEKRLGWLGKYPEPRLDSNYKGSATPNLSQQLENGDFRKGLDQ